MAFFLQLRSLKKRVAEHVNSIQDREKSGNGHRLSGATGQNGLPHSFDAKEDVEDEDGNKIDLEKFPYAALPDVSVANLPNGKDEKYYKVDWESASDGQNPRNWPMLRKLRATFVLVWIAFVVTAASSIDSAVALPAAMGLHVSMVTETLATAMFLIGFGTGSLLTSPLSEMLGRWPVYVGSLFVFGCWLVGAALAPNIGAQIVFRFLAGMFASAPLTVAGGSISDLFNPYQKTWAFPIFASTAFGGPALGPVIGAYIAETGVLSWRWAEWIMLITNGLVIVLILLFKGETLAPRLLQYKAYYYRKLTGDDRFKTEMEASGQSTFQLVKGNFTRPFVLALEPIVALFTVYLSIIYIVLFTFLDGYNYIFEMTYGLNPGLSNICFLGLVVGIFSSGAVLPLVYYFTNKQLKRDGDPGDGSKLNQETRLIFGMFGAPLIPIGLFWMGWTDYPSISIWSPIVASSLIGLGIVCIFLAAYMYTIDSYETYSASALTFITLVRYLAAGGMTVVGVPMYQNLDTHWTLTLLGCISALVVPIPFVLYKFGPRIREKSRYAVKR